MSHILIAINPKTKEISKPLFKKGMHPMSAVEYEFYKENSRYPIVIELGIRNVYLFSCNFKGWLGYDNLLSVLDEEDREFTAQVIRSMALLL